VKAMTSFILLGIFRTRFVKAYHVTWGYAYQTLFWIMVIANALATPENSVKYIVSHSVCI